MINYNNKIDVLYMPEMCSTAKSKSSSPNKPQRLMEYINLTKNDGLFNIHQFKPFTKKDFYVAHEKEYVDNFFKGIEDVTALTLIEWSKEMLETLKYTNASLYHSIRQSILKPFTIVLSPTSGFHHATPKQGFDFCSFSGQVIASMKIYEEFGLSGSYIDLDAHYGNSIEDTRKHVPILNKAIPKGFNINPSGEGDNYIKSLEKNLIKLKHALLTEKIHYVVLCHGADSHIDDDLGCGSLSTEQWLHCSDMVYKMIEETSKQMKKNIPLTLSLFGGYRKDNYDFVLDLHLRSILNSIK